MLKPSRAFRKESKLGCCRATWSDSCPALHLPVAEVFQLEDVHGLGVAGGRQEHAIHAEGQRADAHTPADRAAPAAASGPPCYKPTVGPRKVPPLSQEDNVGKVTVLQHILKWHVCCGSRGTQQPPLSRRCSNTDHRVPSTEATGSRLHTPREHSKASGTMGVSSQAQERQARGALTRAGAGRVGAPPGWAAHGGGLGGAHSGGRGTLQPAAGVHKGAGTPDTGTPWPRR